VRTSKAMLADFTDRLFMNRLDASEGDGLPLANLGPLGSRS